MRSVYKRHTRPSDLVPVELFNGIVKTLNAAISDDFTAEYPDLCETLRGNNEVFAAFKVHDQCERMARLLTDEDGNLKSFEQWVREAEPISNHHNKVWLRTEYDTAIKRADQAREWKQFEAERDVLPNLRWVPSTAAKPGADHMVFWDVVRPIDDPFWSHHRPGDRWGCQCSLEATDNPETAIPQGGNSDDPAPGLDGNPATSGKLFSESHPYFPSSCGTCPFNTGDTPTTPTNKVRDCATCHYFLDCKDKVTCREDEVFGQRLLISNQADASELDDNIRAAKAILESFLDVQIKINEHLLEYGKKNPEYTIDGMIADRKGVKGPDGITDGFKKAIKQGCEVVVIDFDKHLKAKQLRVNQVAKTVSWREDNFQKGIIKRCYIVHHGRSVCITKNNCARGQVVEELNKIEP